MTSQQTVIPQGLKSLKTKIDKLKNLSNNIQAKITKISEINPSTNPNSNRKKNKGSTRIVEILKKYKNYVDYLKEILEKKFKKDELIIKLQKDVFTKIEPIIELLNKKPNLAVIEESEELIKKQKNLNQLEMTRDKLSTSNKRYLVDINQEFLETKYPLNGEDGTNAKNLIDLINENNLINCNIQPLQTYLNTAVTSYQNELKQINTSSNGGANTNVPTIEKTDDKLFQALKTDDVFTTTKTVEELNTFNKINETNYHTEKLKKIKIQYETGLIDNINEFQQICEALQELITETINICTIYTQLIKNIKQQNKETKKKQQEAITKLNKDIDEITIEIKSIKEGKANITLLGLNTKELEDIENVFKENENALENIEKEINKKKEELTNLKSLPSPPQQQQQQQGQQGTVQQSEQENNTLSILSESNSLKTVISELNNVNSTDISNNTENMKILEDLSVKLNNLYKTYTNPSDLKQEFQSIPLIPNESIPEDDIIITNRDDIDRYNRIVERINNKTKRIDQLVIYIYVMKKYINADEIKKKLYLEVRKKNLFIQDDPIELERISQQSAGKSKKSKSKSKTSKTTSKNEKTTKKPKTRRTQTKSYNNLEYKNQDGGFVRGGVLFPESFYRSDIVM